MKKIDDKHAEAINEALKEITHHPNRDFHKTGEGEYKMFIPMLDVLEAWKKMSRRLNGESENRTEKGRNS